MKVSLNTKAVLKKKCPTTIQDELQMKPRILQNTLGKRLFAENRACGMKKKKKPAFGGEPNEKYQGQILIKESGDDEYFDSTDESQESNLNMQNNPFID